VTATGSPSRLLLFAKAPVAGLAKTRLAATIGNEAAAELAAAALLDTLDACEGVAGPDARLIALTGDLAGAGRGEEIADRLSRWRVVEQQGETFAARLMHAHHEAASIFGPTAPLVQIGMDTPQLTSDDLLRLADVVSGGPRALEAALGPATDGGWWGLATRTAGYVDGLVDVPMSHHDTCTLTHAALEAAGARVAVAHTLDDVDTFDDAFRVAALAPHTRFAAAFAKVSQAVVR